MISVITVISVLGVAAGVMALVISLAVNNGFRNTLQRNLLRATAHVNLVAKGRGRQASPTSATARRALQAIPHVVAAAPVLYDEVLIAGPLRGKYATLKGIDIRSETRRPATLCSHLKSGSLAGFSDDERDCPA